MTIKKPSPYVPSFLKSALSGSRPLQLTFSEVSDTNIKSTSSFLYDPANTPLKSTQQLNVDWSKFENHTFFMSAEAKVNLAFEQIINGYPFDGTRVEIERFFENLTGYEKWVFDQFPKYHGQLMFSGTQVGETSSAVGSYIVVKDAAGAMYPELSKNKTGTSVLNPKGTSLSIETQLYVPTGSNDVQVICQKMSGSTQGFSLYLSSSVSSTAVDLCFSVVSGAFSMTVPTNLEKGRFNHVCAVLNRELGVHYLELFKNGQTAAGSKTRYVISDMDIDASDFIIGSGTTLNLGTNVVTPKQTLSGTLDEFRLFHSARSATQQQLYSSKTVFATPDLKLYYRFNEPAPPITTSASDSVNAIVIDSSGNSLHSLISNFSSSLRLDASIDPTSQVIYEKEETVPVLFPAHPDVIALNVDLLTSASLYDQANPNLITRLVPQHYLLEGAAFEGHLEPEGQGNDAYGGSGIPGQGELGSVQLFLSLLYIWARFFDEMKLFVDAFSSLRTVDYELNTSMPNNFLHELVRQYGFNLPPLFNDSTIEQYIHAENVDQFVSTNESSLKQVQNELLRRVLINLPDVLKSKGTQHSIKAFLRAVGIDPENSVRLREYGGPTSRQLSFARETKREVGTLVQFISSSFTHSPYLLSSRVEPGFPSISGLYLSSTLYYGTFSGSAVLLNLSGAYSSSVGTFPGSSIVSGTTTYGLLNGTFSGSQSGSLPVFSGSISSAIVVSGFLTGTAVTGSVTSGSLLLGTFVNSVFTGSFMSGTTLYGTTATANDGLLTSGSWTVESIVKFTPYHIRNLTSPTQSLARLCVTGSMTNPVGIVANLLAISASSDARLMLYVRAGNAASSPTMCLTMPLANSAVFNHDKWNVSFGCERNDAMGSRVSSSYFLRLATQNNGELQFMKTTSSYFYENPATGSNVFRTLDTVTNTNSSGTFLAIGKNQTLISGSGNNYLYLNNTSKAPSEALATDLGGMVSNLRFWSKALTQTEWTEHVLNYRSLGVEDPLVNYNFVTTRTGSFERVRMDTFSKQETRRACATASLGTLGTINFLDFSLNNMHMTGTGFPIDADCVKGDLFDLSYLSPNFDEASTNEKIRIRSYLNQDLVDATPWAGVAPVYEILKSEKPTDDVRFAIEFSLIDALNRDIVTMFSTFDAIDNAIGSPELLFSPDYPDLDKLRTVYFNRIQEKLNFKSFFEFFRWFDMSIGTFIEQLVPRKTNFKGTNFVIESHMLERHKLEYYGNEIYLSDAHRARIRDVLLVQQIAGAIKKH